MLKLHREGRQIIMLATILTAVLVFGLGYLPLSLRFLGITISLLAIVVLGLILWFFRDPKREIFMDENNILAPADGKVVVIEKVFEDEFLKAEAMQVSIFMSPLNVHLNRNPVSGKVSYFKYHPGQYLVAWHPKSSTLNERTTTVYALPSGTQVLMRQIAGKLARRIRWYIREGEAVTQGGEMGFIRFGSRVDLYLPLNAEIKVKIGDLTTGGESVIGKLWQGN